MRIRLAIVNPRILAPVRIEVDRLRSAVDTGDLDGADAATETLLALTADCHSVDMSEEEWRAFVEGIRSQEPGFRSDYLLPGDVCAGIFPTVAATDFVLELPIDGESGKESPSV